MWGRGKTLSKCTIHTSLNHKYDFITWQTPISFNVAFFLDLTFKYHHSTNYSLSRAEDPDLVFFSGDLTWIHCQNLSSNLVEIFYNFILKITLYKYIKSRYAIAENYRLDPFDYRESG